MSYILDALKRAEQQRGVAARATARAPLATTFERALRVPWRWIAGGAVGVIAVVAAVALWPTTEPSPTSVSSPSDVAAVPVPAAPPAPPPRPSAAPPPRVATPRAERSVPARVARPPLPDHDLGNRTAAAPETLPRPVPRPAESAAPPRPADGVASPRPVRPAPRVESWSVPRRDDVAAARRSPREDDSTLVARPAPRDARGTPAIPEGAPPAGAGGELKALAARMSLQVLTWAPDPKDRFVFLNGRRYGEGQLVDDKFLVERINEDGVVLSYRGERVTLKGR